MPLAGIQTGDGQVVITPQADAPCGPPVATGAPAVDATPAFTG